MGEDAIHVFGGFVCFMNVDVPNDLISSATEEELYTPQTVLTKII